MRLSPRTLLVCRAERAKICCVVLFKCNCGKEFTGSHAKADQERHQKKCKQGVLKVN